MDNKLQNFGRRTRGKKRGQFAKKSVVIGRDNNAIAVSKRKAMDREVSSTYIHSKPCVKSFVIKLFYVY